MSVALIAAGSASALAAWMFLIAIAWAVLQLRPIRRTIWTKRWRGLPGEFVRSVWADAVATVRLLVVGPALRLWHRRDEKSLIRAAHDSIDETIDRLLGRNKE